MSRMYGIPQIFHSKGDKKGKKTEWILPIHNGD